MYNFVTVDDLHTSDNLIEDIEGFIQRKYFVCELTLNGVKITHIAILHH